jgi:hypothetical protein
MPDGTSNYLPQYVPPIVSGGVDPVRYQKSCGTCVVGDDSQRGIALKIGPVDNVSQFSSLFYQRLKQIRIEIADLTLQDGGEAFEACARVNRGFR